MAAAMEGFAWKAERPNKATFIVSGLRVGITTSMLVRCRRFPKFWQLDMLTLPALPNFHDLDCRSRSGAIAPMPWAIGSSWRWAGLHAQIPVTSTVLCFGVCPASSACSIHHSSFPCPPHLPSFAGQHQGAGEQRPGPRTVRLLAQASRPANKCVFVCAAHVALLAAGHKRRLGGPSCTCRPAFLHHLA